MYINQCLFLSRNSHRPLDLDNVYNEDQVC